MTKGHTNREGIMFRTHKPATPAENAAAKRAHEQIAAAGFTPSDDLTHVSLIPGNGANVFAASIETIPGTFGHPAAEAIEMVTI